MVWDGFFIQKQGHLFQLPRLDLPDVRTVLNTEFGQLRSPQHNAPGADHHRKQEDSGEYGEGGNAQQGGLTAQFAPPDTEPPDN